MFINLCHVTIKEVITLVNENKQFLDEAIEQDVVNLFKAIANPARIRILYVLKQNPLTVTEISNVLDMSQSAISHHLKDLKMARLVSFHKEGRKVIYQLDDNHVHKLFDTAVEHVKELYNYE